MKKHNSFISNPIILSTFLIIAFFSFVLLLLIIILNVDELFTNIFLQIVSILLRLSSVINMNMNCRLFI
jgi:hypothetical protein